MSLEELEATFDQEILSHKRAAAETAYALAFRYRNEDVNGTRRFDIARTWALRAIEILDSLPSNTLGEIASTRSSVGGIPIPDVMHGNTVRDRLSDILA